MKSRACGVENPFQILQRSDTQRWGVDDRVEPGVRLRHPRRYVRTGTVRQHDHVLGGAAVLTAPFDRNLSPVEGVKRIGYFDRR